MSDIGTNMYKIPQIVKINAKGSNVLRNIQSKSNCPADGKKRVASKDFKPKIAIFPEIPVFNTLFLKKLYLSTQK
jgi:hypothetical protein